MRLGDRELLDAHVFAVSCFKINSGRMAEAIRQLGPQSNREPQCRVADVRGFTEYGADNFQARGSMWSVGGQGRHKVMPNETVTEVARIIAARHRDLRSFGLKGHGHEYTRNQNFTSLHQATAHSAIIREVQQQLGCRGDEGAQSHHLLHQGMPTLMHSRLPKKAPLILDARCWQVAMSEWPENEPGPLDEFFWDGTCIAWGSRHKTGKFVVWFDRRDLYGKPPTQTVCSSVGVVCGTIQAPAWSGFWVRGVKLRGGRCLLCVPEFSTVILCQQMACGQGRGGGVDWLVWHPAAKDWAEGLLMCFYIVLLIRGSRRLLCLSVLLLSWARMWSNCQLSLAAAELVHHVGGTFGQHSVFV